jgi:hypothetical protein
MDNALHFASVAAGSLARLTTLIEQAAALLDQRGSLRLRKSIVKELHFSLSAVRAIHTASTWNDGTPGPFLAAEIKRARSLKAGGKGRPHLTVIAGTDVEARGGTTA